MTYLNWRITCSQNESMHKKYDITLNINQVNDSYRKTLFYLFLILCDWLVSQGHGKYFMLGLENNVLMCASLCMLV